ncbi:MAG: hypothetical protein AMJ43_00825 [Coxiella sp. DG_40]|nr:MAG: hypothetical protein AMJ43_00825 [Coxiella sp. DG_40]
MNSHNNGILYVVATPIGNLNDVTLRALETLKKVDHIAAEDTRHSKKLLQHFGIKKPMISLHNYNERERSKVLLKRLQKGEDLALISDAGTPLISDPGYRLVKLIRNVGINIVPIPGPCAAITALCVSGLPTDKFIFEGFLPMKAVARCKRLQELISEPRTIIFYEAPHRMKFLISDLLNVFGKDRHAVLARELTKKFETIYGASLSELKSWFEMNKARQKGEFVVLLHGAELKRGIEINEEALHILKILLRELAVKQAVILTAKITGVSKNKLYKVAITLSH